MGQERGCGVREPDHAILANLLLFLQCGASLLAQLVKNPPNVGNLGSIPGLGRYPWRRDWLPTPVFCPGEFHELYSRWCPKESDLAEHLSLSLQCGFHNFSFSFPPSCSCQFKEVAPLLLGLRWTVRDGKGSICYKGEATVLEKDLSRSRTKTPQRLCVHQSLSCV